MPRKRYVELSEKEARFVGLTLIILFTLCVILLVYSLFLNTRIEKCDYENQQLKAKLERLTNRLTTLAISTSTLYENTSIPTITLNNDAVCSSTCESTMRLLNSSSTFTAESTMIGTSTQTGVFEIEKFDYVKYFKKSTDYYTQGESFIVIKSATDSIFKLIVDMGLPYFLMRDSTDSTFMKLVLIGRNGRNPEDELPESVNPESLNIHHDWYAVQILAHGNGEVVRKCVKELRNLMIPAIDYVFKTNSGRILHGLVLGIFTDIENAREFSKNLDESTLIEKYGPGVKRRYIRKIR